MKFLTCLVIVCALVPDASAFNQSAAPTAAEVDKAIEDNGGNPAEFHQVFTRLQQAVAKHDSSAVAALVNYPIAVKYDKRTRILRTPQAFINQYDNIFTPEITSAVEGQKYRELFVNDQGAMFGNGQVWIAGICRDKDCKRVDIKIRTIQSAAP